MIYEFEDYLLDTQQYELRKNGDTCPLEPQVFDVLAYLVEHHDRMVPKEELLDHVWPERYISEAALNSRLMAARKAIGDSGSDQRLIRTVRGRGFRFVGEVVRRDPQGSVPSSGSSEPADLPVVAETGPSSPPPETKPAPSQQIRFCLTPDGVRLAYAVMGSGPPIVKAANWLTHLDYDLDSPIWGHLLKELATKRTLIRYDERSFGLSDWDVETLTFDSFVRDLESVVEATGIERFPLVGISQGAPVAIAYAVAHPERVSHLILVGGYTKGWGLRGTEAQQQRRDAMATLIRTSWGKEDDALRFGFSLRFAPKGPGEAVGWLTDLQRVSATAENAYRFQTVSRDIDVEGLLTQIQVPTLVMHATRDQVCPFSEGRRLAATIPNARFVPLDSDNHLTLEHEPAWETVRTEIWRFLEDGAD